MPNFEAIDSARSAIAFYQSTHPKEALVQWPSCIVSHPIEESPHTPLEIAAVRNEAKGAESA